MPLVSMNKLQELTGRDRRTIKKRLESLIPIQEGRSHLYESKEALELIYLEESESSEDLDLTEERARLTFHQANIAELDEKVKRGDLIPSDIVENVWGNIIANFRSKVLSIPTKTAHAILNIPDITEAQEILKSHIFEALEELAEYDPEQYGITVDREVDQEDCTTA